MTDQATAGVLGADRSEIATNREDPTYRPSQTETTQTKVLKRKRSRTDEDVGRSSQVKMDDLFDQQFIDLTDSTSSGPTVQVGVKLEQIDHKLDELLKSDKVSRDPNYSFVISLLEMLRSIKSQTALAELKAQIFKSIAQSLAAEQSA